MSKSFFGEYLVEKDLLSKKDLIEALVFQAKILPSPLEIVFEDQLMTADDILSVLKKQTESSCDFKVAAEGLGLWTPEIEKRISMEFHKKRTPLGKILLNQKKIEVKELIAALDEFLADRIDDIQAAKPKEIPVSMDAVEPSVEKLEAEAQASARHNDTSEESTEVFQMDEAEQNQASPIEVNAEDSQRAEATEVVSTEPIEEGSSVGDFQQYLSLFNDEQFMVLENHIFSIEPLKSSYVEDLGSVKKNFQPILGAAKLCDLSCSASLLNKVVSTLSLLESKGSEIEESLVWEFKALAKGSIDFLKDIKNGLKEATSEHKYMEDEFRKNHFNHLIEDWGKFIEKTEVSSI